MTFGDDEIGLELKEVSELHVRIFSLVSILFNLFAIKHYYYFIKIKLKVIIKADKRFIYLKVNNTLIFFLAMMASLKKY